MSNLKGLQLPPQLSEQEDLLNRITNRIRQSLKLEEILTATVQEIRLFLNIDRVKIYQFSADGSGEVIAEAVVRDRLPSLLGLHFPAEDIPAHARELFVKARPRVIVDVASQLKTLDPLDNLQGPSETTLTRDIRYSPVDPCHAQYLSAMGVCSSLVIPLLHQNQLWGLLAAHHSESRRFSERELKIMQILVDQVSIAIAQANLLSQAQKQIWHEATIHQISSLLHAPLNLPRMRQTLLEQIVRALEGSGGRLYIAPDLIGQSAELYTYGEQPPVDRLEAHPFWKQQLGTPAKDGLPNFSYDCPSQALPGGETSLFDPATLMNSFTHAWSAQWQDELCPHPPSCLLPVTGAAQASLAPPDSHYKTISVPCAVTDLYQNPQLQDLVPAFQETLIRSLLVVPLKYGQQCVGCLTLFRNQVETETLWAGRRDLDSRNEGPRLSFEAWLEVKNDQAQPWLEEEIKLAQSLGNHVYMAIMQRRVEEIIQHKASHDPLTGLPNRILFNDRVSLALANAYRSQELLAVVFLDLDRFQAINDTLGHAIGDQMLQLVAKRLSHCLRDGDTIARWGGDEFTLLLPYISCAEDAVRVAQRLLKALSEPLRLQEQDLYVTASLGIAIAPYDGEDLETLLKHSDTAMNRAKQQGKNRYQLYSPKMNIQALEKLVLESDLHKALEREEFLLYYQPQVDLAGQIVGMEALIRWQHPQWGLLSPGAFIAIAEETGLILPIGEWVLRTACAQTRAWQQAGLPPFHIAVNLSVRQFQQRNLVQMIAQVLQDTQLSPRYLEIEITESVAMQDADRTVLMLRQLQAMGVAIAIDDFGTGYSSLGALKSFPVNTLKIDRSFVQDLVHDPSDAAIIQAMIALAHGLKLKVVAEGVETLEQLECLRSLNSDTLQGYLFGQPLPAEAATQLCFEGAKWMI